MTRAETREGERRGLPAPSTSPSITLGRVVPGLGVLPGPLAAAVDGGAMGMERERGQVLFDQEGPCTGLLLLDRGAVRVSLASEGGREILLYRVRPGETCVLTLGCLLGEDRYPARGVVEEDVSGLFLPAVVFHRLLNELPAFRAFVFAAFSSRLRGVLALASAVAFERLDRRLAALLLERVERGRLLEIEVTHQQLADELGCAREAVSRLLEELAAQGALALARGRLRVLDKSLLERA